MKFYVFDKHFKRYFLEYGCGTTDSKNMAFLYDSNEAFGIDVYEKYKNHPNIELIVVEDFLDSILNK